MRAFLSLVISFILAVIVVSGQEKDFKSSGVVGPRKCASNLAWKAKTASLGLRKAFCMLMAVLQGFFSSGRGDVPSWRANTPTGSPEQRPKTVNKGNSDNVKRTVYITDVDQQVTTSFQC